eukprot:PhM_4_TR7543/c0_g1_i1/m.76743/K01106/E3.1.3.56; inositol-1,4,5-trisphosphate 5-phosphatase
MISHQSSPSTSNNIAALSNTPHVVVLTQNIGCLDSSSPLEVEARTAKRMSLWMASLRQWVLDSHIDVLVCHFQEIGGKRHHAVFQAALDEAVRVALPSDAFWSSGLLMQYSSGKTFTAVGSVIFVADAWRTRMRILHYPSRTYVPLPAASFAIDDVADYCYNHKLAEAEKSRKGFLAVSLQLRHDGSDDAPQQQHHTMHFANVHLFHDADNSVAVAVSPSEYALKRQRGVVEIVDVLLRSALYDRAHALFLCGDLNTRLDGAMLVRDHPEIKVEPKMVHMPKSSWEMFYARDTNWAELRQYDLEGRAMIDAVAAQTSVNLCELPREFGPTYSVCNEEGLSDKLGEYKEERVPAWCDRVFVNAAALSQVSSYNYWIAPLHLFDHHGVYMEFIML